MNLPDGPLAGALYIIAIASFVAGWYLSACYAWPFVKCPTCEGTGKRRSPSGKAFRLCRRCKGTARRLRWGRRAWNYVRRTIKEVS